MKTKDQFAGVRAEELTVVLVSPRNPLNIGAAARAMANFGVRELRVVTPFERAWREAKSAVEAEGVMEAAREFGSLAEALRDQTLALGTGTSKYRRPEQEHLYLPEVAGFVERWRGDGDAGGGRVALVFGSEKYGLTREDLSLCQGIVEIPTRPEQPSMNLGQAVAVCLYGVLFPSGAKAPDSMGRHDGTTEVVPLHSTCCAANSTCGADSGGEASSDPRSQNRDLGHPVSLGELEKKSLLLDERGIQSITLDEIEKQSILLGEREKAGMPLKQKPPEDAGERIPVGDYERLTEMILLAARMANYSPRSMEQANREDLRLMLRRWEMKRSDVKRAMGLFRRIEWMLRRHGVTGEAERLGGRGASGKDGRQG